MYYSIKISGLGPGMLAYYHWMSSTGGHGGAQVFYYSAVQSINTCFSLIQDSVLWHQLSCYSLWSWLGNLLRLPNLGRQVQGKLVNMEELLLLQVVCVVCCHAYGTESRRVEITHIIFIYKIQNHSVLLAIIVFSLFTASGSFIYRPTDRVRLMCLFIRNSHCNASVRLLFLVLLTSDPCLPTDKAADSDWHGDTSLHSFHTQLCKHTNSYMKCCTLMELSKREKNSEFVYICTLTLLVCVSWTLQMLWENTDFLSECLYEGQRQTDRKETGEESWKKEGFIVGWHLTNISSPPSCFHWVVTTLWIVLLNLQHSLTFVLLHRVLWREKMSDHQPTRLRRSCRLR